MKPGCIAGGRVSASGAFPCAGRRHVDTRARAYAGTCKRCRFPLRAPHASHVCCSYNMLRLSSYRAVAPATPRRAVPSVPSALFRRFGERRPPMSIGPGEGHAYSPAEPSFRARTRAQKRLAAASLRSRCSASRCAFSSSALRRSCIQTHWGPCWRSSARRSASRLRRLRACLRPPGPKAGFQAGGGIAGAAADSQVIQLGSVTGELLDRTRPQRWQCLCPGRAPLRVRASCSPPTALLGTPLGISAGMYPFRSTVNSIRAGERASKTIARPINANKVAVTEQPSLCRLRSSEALSSIASGWIGLGMACPDKAHMTPP